MMDMIGFSTAGANIDLPIAKKALLDLSYSIRAYKTGSSKVTVERP